MTGAAHSCHSFVCTVPDLDREIKFQADQIEGPVQIQSVDPNLEPIVLIFLARERERLGTDSIFSGREAKIFGTESVLGSGCRSGSGRRSSGSG